jgi:hypothetical protein
MSATIETPNLFYRACLAMAALTRGGLMLAGALLVAGVFAVSQGDRRLVERLHALLPASDGDYLPVVVAASSADDEDAQAVVDPLSPRMRSALESVARRYRVSMGALEPIFVAAEAAGRDLRLDPLLIVAVIAVESRFNPFSESVMGAQGLMQVMPRFHQDKLPDGADELSFFDPVLNVRIGARILKESIRRNGGVVPGLQQFAGAADDAEQRYSAKVLQEKARLEASVKRAPMREA